MKDRVKKWFDVKYCVRKAMSVLNAKDGGIELLDWATHLAFIDSGRVRLHERLEAIRELHDLREAHASAPLYRLVERWLRD